MTFDKYICLKVKVLVAQSCPILCNLMDCSLPASSVHGILQTRLLEWVTIPLSRGSSWPRDGTQVTAWLSTAQNRLYLLDLGHFFGLPSIWTLLGKSSPWIWVGGKDRLLLEDLTHHVLPPGLKFLHMKSRTIPSLETFESLKNNTVNEGQFSYKERDPHLDFPLDNY